MFGGVVWSEGCAEGRVHVQPSLLPLNVEVGGEGDAVVLVIDPQHLVDVDGHPYHVCLFCGNKASRLEKGLKKYLYMEAQILNNCWEGRGTWRCPHCI